MAPLHVQPMSYWTGLINKMDIDSLTKVKKHISHELMQRQLKTLTTDELSKLLALTKKNISNLSVIDEGEISVEDCV